MAVTRSCACSSSLSLARSDVRRAWHGTTLICGTPSCACAHNNGRPYARWRCVPRADTGVWARSWQAPCRGPKDSPTGIPGAKGTAWGILGWAPAPRRDVQDACAKPYVSWGGRGKLRPWQAHGLLLPRGLAFSAPPRSSPAPHPRASAPALRHHQP